MCRSCARNFALRMCTLVPRLENPFPRQNRDAEEIRGPPEGEEGRQKGINERRSSFEREKEGADPSGRRSRFQIARACGAGESGARIRSGNFNTDTRS